MGLSKKSVFEKVMRHKSSLEGNSAVKRNILAFRPELPAFVRCNPRKGAGVSLNNNSHTF